MDPDLQRRAKLRADVLGISLAEYIRRAVARDLDPPVAKADVSAIFSLGNSGGSNIAKYKDQMIADAIAAKLERNRRPAR